MTNRRSIWRTHGVRVISTPMQRVTASDVKGVSDASTITFGRTGAKALSGGAVHLEPGIKTTPHHHGDCETVIVIMLGSARIRWGEELEYAADAERGDLVFVPPFVPHQEINLSDDEPLEFATIHTGTDEIQVNLDIVPAAEVEMVTWDDPNHPTLRRAAMRGIMLGR